MCNPYEPAESDASQELPMHRDNSETIRVPLDAARFHFVMTIGVVFLVVFLAAPILFWLQDSWHVLWISIWYAFYLLIAAFLCHGYYKFLKDPKAYDLIIDSEGVHERYSLGAVHFLWEELESVSVTQLEGPTDVVVFRKNQLTSGRIWTFGRYDGWLQQNYTLPPTKICEIISERLQAFQAEQGIAFSPLEKE
ncbi:MAG: hypothetical protein AAF483_04350 [Planctomycetota bacterium]